MRSRLAHTPLAVRFLMMAAAGAAGAVAAVVIFSAAFGGSVDLSAILPLTACALPAAYTAQMWNDGRADGATPTRWFRWH